MLVILLDMEDDRSRKLYLSEQIEISQDKEYLALCLKLSNHEFLVGK